MRLRYEYRGPQETGQIENKRSKGPRSPLTYRDLFSLPDHPLFSVKIHMSELSWPHELYFRGQIKKTKQNQTPRVSICGFCYPHFHSSGTAAREKDVSVSILTGGQEREMWLSGEPSVQCSPFWQPQGPLLEWLSPGKKNSYLCLFWKCFLTYFLLICAYKLNIYSCLHNCD